MFRFDNSYAALGQPYAVAQPPDPVQAPTWLAWNQALADELGWPEAWGQNDATLLALAGNAALPGAEPVATAYAGHQFGSYNPRLGDGRAILLGELLTPAGKRVDIQLKGAGTTPFSRGGDGRSPVGPVVREYLISEAMHALGVPTTRALAAVATGQRVFRERAEPGAVLTRVASSHLRIGTIQYFATTCGGDGLPELVDYAIERHYPEALAARREQDPSIAPAQVLLEQVSARLAALVATWQSLGFVHGVLNTDNMLLCGETIDYGPCAFLDSYRADQVFSSIDVHGRYAFSQQPLIVHWNIGVLANALLPLIHSDPDTALARAQAAVNAFPVHFGSANSRNLARKFGLDAVTDEDTSLCSTFYGLLETHGCDHTLAFRWLTEFAAGELPHNPIEALFRPPAALLEWLQEWQARRQRNHVEAAASLEAMRSANPVVIPRNHQVVRAIAAAERGDTGVLAQLFRRLATPCEWAPDDADFAAPPETGEAVLRTFCGT